MPTRTASGMRNFLSSLFAVVLLALSAPAFSLDFPQPGSEGYKFTPTTGLVGYGSAANFACIASNSEYPVWRSSYGKCTLSVNSTLGIAGTMRSPLSGTCPSNSTAFSSSTTSNLGSTVICRPDSGFSSVQDGSGNWSVVAAGSECPSNEIYNSSTGVCGDAGALTFAAAAALAALAIFLGISVGSLIAAAGGLAAAGWLALIALTGGGSELAGTPQQDIDALKPPITVDLKPPVYTPPIKNDDTAPKVVRNPQDKSLNPGGGSSAPSPSGGGQWTPTESGGWQYKSPDGQEIAIIGRTPENNGDQVIIKNNPSDHSNKPTQTTIRSYNDGSLSTQYSGPVNTGTGTNIGTAQRVYSNDISSGSSGSGGGAFSHFYFNPLNLDGSGFDPEAPVTPDTGSGTGNGSGTGAGSGVGGEGNCKLPDGRSCASEESLSGIKDAITGVGVNPAAALNGLEGRLDSVIDASALTNQGAIDQSDIQGSVTGILETVNDLSPWKALSYDQAASCTYSAPPIFGKPVTLSICAAQPTLHLVVAFFFFVLLLFGIINLIFERPETN